MKQTINADQRGLKFKKGKLVQILGPGIHRFSEFMGTSIQVFKVNEEFLPEMDLSVLLEDKELFNTLLIVEVGDEEICLLYEDNHFKTILKSGKHAFWKNQNKYKFLNFNTINPEIPQSVPRQILSLPEMQDFITTIEVAAHENALLFYDGIFQKKLNAGKYHFWKGPVSVQTPIFDLRQLQIDITGQEIMTKDKVSLRLNCVCHYKISDPQILQASIKDYKEQLHIIMQLILREYIGKLNLDELLEQKEEIGTWTIQEIKKRIPNWGIEFISIGVKDIVLPGEIRTILQQVLNAEKRALANTITRREETASTRSLLNTAKLMQDNPFLWKLKQMEHIENISAKINQINLKSGESINDQLFEILGANKDS